jgi:hypothetical protein
MGNPIDLIFIIPYRNREAHRTEYIRHMSEQMKKENHNAIFLFVHQCDDKPFNRGAMLNIGYLQARTLTYATNLKFADDLVIVMQDVDILPKNTNSFQWKPTTTKCIRHVIGEPKINLGGIMSFYMSDRDLFESVNGFPNYYGWGPEDWVLRRRLEAKNIPVDEINQTHHMNPYESIMLPHPPSNNPPAVLKYKSLYAQEKRGEIPVDGLDKLRYSFDFHPIDYTDDSLFFICDIKFEVDM